MKYGKRWMDKFGLSAAVWAGFNLYFFFFIQDGKGGYLVLSGYPFSGGYGMSDRDRLAEIPGVQVQGGGDDGPGGSYVPHAP